MIYLTKRENSECNDFDVSECYVNFHIVHIIIFPPLVVLQDAHNCIPEFDEETAMFSVYDGHGGKRVALCSLYIIYYYQDRLWHIMLALTYNDFFT